MKKVSIFWKTMMITISIILITVIIIFGLFLFLLPTITQNMQKNTFNAQVEEIESTLSSTGIVEEEIKKLEKGGISVFILNGDDIVYPTLLLSNRDEDIIIDIDNLKEEELGDNNFEISLNLSNKENSFSHSFSLDDKGTKYDVMIYKYIDFSTDDSKDLVKSIFPYFISVGVLVSFIFSFLYASFFQKKIKNLINIMDDMKNNNFSFPTQYDKGDELQSLENEIVSLYKQLCDEVLIVQKLEEERQSFLRGVTHELKTPIMIMTVNIESLLENNDSNKEMLYECYHSLKVMSSLVSEILDVAKIETVKDIDIVSTEDVLDDVLETYQCLLEDKNISLNKVIFEDYLIRLPINHLSKIISNILSNVIKYATSNSMLYIEITDEYIHFINEMDNGSSIDIDRIMEAFVTFNDTEVFLQKSHGLGLYIISSILKQYDIVYSCWVENNEFHLRIGK